MDELMLMNYLKSKGMGDMSEHEFVHKFKEFMHTQGRPSLKHNNMEGWDYPDYDMDIKYRKGMSKRNQLGYYDMYAEYPEYAAHSEGKYGKPYSRFELNDFDDDYPMHNTRKAKGMREEHFNEHYARYIVSEMYHMEGNRKHFGEKFSMPKAKEVHERYAGIIPHNVTACDVYVAINAQYHDYVELFKSWFGSDVESKIIESAIVFWFKDSDYTKGFKLTEYFNED